MTSRHAREWPRLLASAREILDRLEIGAAHLELATAGKQWDGYPASSAGAGDGRGGGVGFDGRMASLIDGEDLGPAGQMRDDLLAALAALRRADGHLTDLTRAPRSTTDDHPGRQAPGCVNCARFDIYTVAVKAGRCQACYMYRWRTGDGRDAPERLVLARPANRPARAPAEDVEAWTRADREGDATASPPSPPHRVDSTPADPTWARAFELADDSDDAVASPSRRGTWFGQDELLDLDRVLVDDEVHSIRADVDEV